MKDRILEEIEKLREKKLEIASKLSITTDPEEKELLEKEIEMIEKQIKTLQDLLKA